MPASIKAMALANNASPGQTSVSDVAPLPPVGGSTPGVAVAGAAAGEGGVAVAVTGASVGEGGTAVGKTVGVTAGVGLGVGVGVGSALTRSSVPAESKARACSVAALMDLAEAKVYSLR